MNKSTVIIFVVLVVLEYLTGIYFWGENRFYTLDTTNEIPTFIYSISGNAFKALCLSVLAVVLVPFPIAPCRGDLVSFKVALISFAGSLWIDVIQTIFGCGIEWSYPEEIFTWIMLLIASRAYIYWKWKR